EVFAHGATSVSRQILHSGRVRGSGGDNNGVFQGAELFELAHHVVDRRGFLADRNVNAGYVLAFLADDRIDGDSSFTCLTVTNNQFALTTADRHHGVD